MQEQLLKKLHSYECKSVTNDQTKNTKDNKNNQKSTVSLSHSRYIDNFFKSTI